MKMKFNKRHIRRIEDKFFDLDHEKHIAYMDLTYECPSDLFDKDVFTKEPMISDELISGLTSMFSYLPIGYKLDIRINFNDMEGYSEEDLRTLFVQNLELELMAKVRNNFYDYLIAFSFCAIGLGFVLVSILLKNYWTQPTIFQQILIFLADTMATVPFWGALDVLVVQRITQKKEFTNIARRFGNIEFKKKED